MAPVSAARSVSAILEAALGGRTSMLLLSADAAMPVDGNAQEDPLDASAAATLRHGGDVRMLPEGDMPGGFTAAAILRY